MCHEIAERCLKSGDDAFKSIGSTHSVDGFDFVFSDDDAAITQAYIDNVRERVTPDHEVFFERHLDCSPWLGCEADGTPMGGTADCVLYDSVSNTLNIIDLKTGQGRVMADDGQLAIYALGAVHTLLAPVGVEPDQIRMVIVQPKIGHIDEHTLITADLRAFGEQVKAAAQAAMHPDAPLVPGQAQCRWCDAKGNCPAAADLAFATLPATLDPAPAAVEAIPDDRLAEILGKADYVEQFLSALRAEALRRLESGGRVPGWKLVQGKRGARKWADPEAVAEYLNKSVRLKREAYTKSEVLSPAALQKALVKSGELSDRQWAKLQELITQSDGAVGIAPESDKRPAMVVNTTAEAVFSEIE
jgi:hypothetical protein